MKRRSRADRNEEGRRYSPGSAVGARTGRRRFALLPGILLSIAGSLLLPAAAFAEPGRGPLRIRNFFPPHLMFLMPGPAAPWDGGAGRLELTPSVAYSAVFVYEDSERWIAAFDMEMTVLELALKIGLSRNFSIGADLAFASMSGGFLDSFLEGFHDAFGLPNYGREQRPRNEFLYVIRKDGEDWLESKFGGMHPLDPSVSLEYLLADRGDPRERPGRFTAGLQYALKLPLGDADAGFGSGRVDHRLSLPMRWVRNPFALYLVPAVSFLSDPDTLGADVRVRNVVGAFLSGEWAFGKRWSALIGFNCHTSPFETTGIHQLDVESVQLDLGFIWSRDDSIRLELSFSEDLTRSAPDFSLRMALGYRF